MTRDQELSRQRAQRAAAGLALLLGLLLVPLAAANAAKPPIEGSARATQTLPEDDLAAEISDAQIGVTSTFQGAKITIFGVRPTRRAKAGNLIVLVRGPDAALVVTRKRRYGPFWLPADPVSFRQVPGLHMIASSSPAALDALAPAGSGLFPLETARRTPLEAGRQLAGPEQAEYDAAILRLQAKAWWRDDEALRLLPGGLFRLDLRLPATAPVGEYAVDVLLVNKGRVIARRSSPLSVARVGIEHDIHTFAHRYSLLYGLLVVAFSVATGWGASFLLRRR